MSSKTPNSAIENIISQLKYCDLETLCSIKPILSDLIQEIESTLDIKNKAINQERRREERYSTELSGTLTRLSDLHPGDKREFQVKILDMSRNGMSLKIDSDYIPSRINRITFIGFGGKVKEIYMQVVRMQKKVNSDCEWINLGCRVVTQEEIRLVRNQEEKVVQVLNRLHRKKELNILLVGQSTKENQSLHALLVREDISHKQVDSIHQVLDLIERESFDLALFTNWDAICQNALFIDRLNAKASNLAKVALIKSNQNHAVFLKSGIDACLNRHDDRHLLMQALERGLLQHISRDDKICQTLKRKTLLISIENETINLFSYLFQEHNFFSQIYPNVRDINPQSIDGLDLAFVEFNDQNIKEFQTACRQLAKFPVIAICQEAAQGRLAISNGAKDFLSLPPREEDFQLILDNWIGSMTF